MILNMEADAILSAVESDLSVIVIAGSNGGCYIEMKDHNQILLSYRYASHDPDDKFIKDKVNHLKAYLGI